MTTICLFVAGPKGPGSPRFRSVCRKRGEAIHHRSFGSKTGARWFSYSTCNERKRTLSVCEARLRSI